MGRKRKAFSNEFKAKAAIEAIKGLKTITEIAQEYEVHPNQTDLWKKCIFLNIPRRYSPVQEGQRQKIT